MPTFKKTAIISLALASFVVSTYSAEAGRRHRNLALGIVGGLVAGAAIAGSRHRHYDDDYYHDDRRVYRPRRTRYSAHVNWCLNRYNSYDPGSDTWVAYSGAVRTCRSPYRR